MPRDLAPGGARSRGGEITGTSDPLFLSVIYAYAFWRLCLIEANYKETENSNI